MGVIFFVLIGIILLFFILLAIKTLFKNPEDFCVLCLSVSLTWLILLTLLYLDILQDAILISLLIGGSIVGFLYYLDSKLLSQNLREVRIFKLPFFLTLIIIAYFLITFNISVSTIILLILLWIVFFIFFALNEGRDTSLGKFINKIIECCKNW